MKLYGSGTEGVKKTKISRRCEGVGGQGNRMLGNGDRWRGFFRTNHPKACGLYPSLAKAGSFGPRARQSTRYRRGS
jgi:hypothetical protein